MAAMVSFTGRNVGIVPSEGKRSLRWEKSAKEFVSALLCRVAADRQLRRHPQRKLASPLIPHKIVRP
jgi:hypothetical protein